MTAIQFIHSTFRTVILGLKTFDAANSIGLHYLVSDHAIKSRFYFDSSAVAVSAPLSPSDGFQRPAFVQRSMWCFASSTGISLIAFWSAIISFSSNAFLRLSGRVSNTSMGSSPPGPILSSLVSSTYSYSFPSSPMKVFLFSRSLARSSSFTLARALIFSANESTSSFSPCIFSCVSSFLKKGMRTSRGSDFPIDFVRSSTYCTIRYCLTVFLISSLWPSISWSRAFKRRKPEQCSWSNSGFLIRNPWLRDSVVSFEYVSSFFS
mmetsp:Transcript_29543/g.71986  ORF Transcript_29543/g.71986 Transcript_29543/m.71986 type:complete len:264 (-) Transcript_29543:576-1367(-)